jgi:hypothetical protein
MNDSDLFLVEEVEGELVQLHRLVGSPDAIHRLRQSTGGEEGPRYFGLNPYPDPSTEGKLGYYVGVGRFPESPQRVLQVSARKFQGSDGSRFEIDYVRTYAMCAADPEVSRHLDKCLTVYADEAPIDVEDASNWSPLIALAYLNALHILVQRHLRRGFITREETLRGRVRGQIRTSRYITRGLARAHPEAVPCRFEALEHDTLENRILRTALVGASRLLDWQSGLNLDTWRTWARQVDAALAGATITRIEPRDFQAARKAGSYRHYATPLALAKAVLARVGFDPNKPLERNDVNWKVRMIPFRLATAELFERYVEVCLPGVPEWHAWAGYHDQNIGSPFKVRPDFLLWSGKQRVILDAKYKNLSIQNAGGADEDNPLRWDVYQTLAYSRHRAVQAKFAPTLPSTPPAIVLCYPTRGSDNALSEAKSALNAALTLGVPVGTMSRRYCDFDLPVILFGLPIPTVPG